ncbi:hypothetical protein ApDm4_0721 [Acetobacter pomorum]|nr:hypothetical protein ApDm4_0721 [Acetobacter pomorum]
MTNAINRLGTGTPESKNTMPHVQATKGKSPATMSTTARNGSFFMNVQQAFT